ncbi:hypothetical protein RUM44_011960 [Polyplax serrata]|uniref:Uncharacterized protein n=1 Tax=Polyplax serrata TaxID=468196 RepID=A0ABR1BDV2_POLSC
MAMERARQISRGKRGPDGKEKGTRKQCYFELQILERAKLASHSSVHKKIKIKSKHAEIIDEKESESNSREREKEEGRERSSKKGPEKIMKLKLVF